MYLTEHHTERLLLRPLTEDDIPAWTVFCSDPQAIEFLSMPYDTPEENAVFWIRRQLARYESGMYGMLGLVEKASGRLVGQSGLLLQTVDGVTELEIGYHLLPEFQGKGFATEAAGYLKNFAFKNPLSDSVISIIDPLNLPSQRVAVRNGMTIEHETLVHDKPHFIFRVWR